MLHSRGKKGNKETLNLRGRAFSFKFFPILYYEPFLLVQLCCFLYKAKAEVKMTPKSKPYTSQTNSHVVQVYQRVLLPPGQPKPSRPQRPRCVLLEVSTVQMKLNGNCLQRPLQPRECCPRAPGSFSYVPRKRKEMTLSYI